MSKLSKSLGASIIVFALGAPVVASAAPQSDLAGTTVKVSYSDLNLQKIEGARVLYRRLQNAARQACDVRSLQIEGSLRNLAESKSCYREALAAAVAKVDNQKVSSIHAG